MAKPKLETGVDQEVAYWREQIAKQQKAYEQFYMSGERVIDRYRIEKANARQDSLQDRYNILYSSTETMRPSLYGETPKVEVTKRHRDRKQPLVANAVAMLESTLTYALEEIDLDEVMGNVIEDYLLPGMGNSWVRYVPTTGDQKDDKGETVTDGDGNAAQVVTYESIEIDYKSWKDVLYGPCRTFKELPWAAKREYMSKEAVAKRFTQAVANALSYTDQSANKNGSRSPVIEDKQAVIWEIWDKSARKVLWIADGYDQLLDSKDDPLKLKNFWPFPKPLRAISNTRTFVPRPFYAQYQAQAEALDDITERMRILTNALNVRGAFDGSVTQLQTLLSAKGGNKMIPIENWHQFIGQSGVNGAIVWVPIDQIVKVLMELYNARERAKAEIYEITGFSDIVRGLSKASETLGAQQIKQDWATGRLRIMQKEIQRYCRDLLRIMAEIAAEHFSDETFALYSGFDPNDPATLMQAQQSAPPPPQPAAPGMAPPAPPSPLQLALDQFKRTVQLLRSERERCANVGIETDSTLLPDEENERKDRLEFLGQIGAFMQQAAPTVQQFPQMAGLLGAMMMFTVRTFRASRPIEQEFERFQDILAASPPQPQEKDNGAAAAQSAVQVAQIKQQGDIQRQQNEFAFKASEAEKDRALQREQAAAQAQTANVELQIKQVELEIKKAELALKQGAAQDDAADAALDRNLRVADAQHTQQMDLTDQAHSQNMDQANLQRQDQQADQSAYEFEQNGQRQDAELDASQQNPQNNSGGA